MFLTIQRIITREAIDKKLNLICDYYELTEETENTLTFNCCDIINTHYVGEFQITFNKQTGKEIA